MQPRSTIGRYQVVAEIGRGGMATVYRAFDPQIKRDVAIKLLPAEFLHNPTFRTRFEQEARTVAALEHPAIVPVYDFGEDGGQPFLVMRLLTGGSLAERIRRGTLPLAEVARIVAALAPGLDHAHALGIVHRDLKPANVLFDGFNNPYLSDFGLVKLIDSPGQLTADSGLFGTPDYMAPEMAGQGRISKLIDIYALGVTIFEMLAGEPPYHADTPVGLLLAHTSQPVPDVRDYLPELPVSVQEVISHAMAKESSARYQSAREIATDLDAIAATGKTQKLAVLRRDLTPQLDKAEVARLSRPRRLPGAAIAVLGVVALVVAIAAVFLASGVPAAPDSLTPSPSGVLTSTATTEAPSPTATQRPTDLPPTTAPTLAASAEPAITLDTLRLVQPVRRLMGHKGLVNAVAWSVDGTLASASGDKTVILWDTRTGERIATLSGHSNWVQGLDFSPDGKQLVSASSDHTAVIWDVLSRQPLRTIKTPLYGLNGVDWSPDGLRLALSPYYITPILWSVQTGQTIRELKGHTEQVNAVTFSPDGAHLASASTDASVLIWDAVTGDPIRQLTGHARSVLSVAWSPDSREIASGSEDQRVMVWDVETGGVLLRLAGHSDRVNAMAWSPDGNIIASGSADGTVRLWNADSGELLRTLDGSAGPVLGIAWSPDGTLIAAAQNTGTVILWGLAP